MPFPFTQNEEDQILDDNDASEQRVITVSTTATPKLADAVTDFYKTYPDLTPWVLIPTAKAYAAGVMDEKSSKDFLSGKF